MALRSSSRRLLTAVRALPTRAQNLALPRETEDVSALVTKAQGPWTELAVEEKVALYRNAYGVSRKEMQNQPTHSGFVFGGVVASVAASYLIFKASNQLAAPRPETISEEWQAATKEKKEKEGLNPIWGTGSKA